jgi:hypothetical protein
VLGEFWAVIHMGLAGLDKGGPGAQGYPGPILKHPAGLARIPALEPTHPIDRGLSLLCALARAKPAVELECQASQGEFFPSGSLPEGEPARSQAELRHWEWFLFERNSVALGDLPMFALESELLERIDGSGEATVNALRYSRAGVFRVTNVEAGDGLWIEDLASHGSLPIAEQEASHDLRVGDLLAGRLYPLGDEQFRLSPAMAVFRDERLAEALKADLERVRGSRRGTLRIAQRELERMFFMPGGSGEAAAVALGGLAAAAELKPPSATRASLLEDARRLRADLENLLSTGADSGAEGLGAERAAQLLAELEGESAQGQRSSAARAMGELLDRVAFESDLNLDLVRRLCLEYWNALASLIALPPEANPQTPAPRVGAQRPKDTQTSGSGPAVGELRPPPSQPTSGGLNAFKRLARSSSSPADATPATDRASRPARDGADRSSAARALSAFDAGRARGDDLDSLFGQLERDLGLDSEGEEDSATIPDFPGIVAALVQEYLWELRAEGAGAEAEIDAPLLEEFARSSSDLGLCEELDGRRLARFATALAFNATADSSANPLPTIERFARWIETQHGHPLWSDYSASAAALIKHLPRLASAERWLRSQGLVGGPSASEELLQTSLEHGDSLGIRDEDGRFVKLRLAPELAPYLLPGDRVYLSWRRGEPQIMGMVAPLPEALPDGD